MDNVTFYVSVLRQQDVISDDVLWRFQTISIGLRCVLSVMGVCTNLLNLKVFLKIGLDETVTISFFTLAVSDFFNCSIATITLVPSLMSFAERIYSLYFYLPPDFMGFYLNAARRIFNVTSILITTFLAIQRCACIVLPFQVKSVYTRFRTFCFMAIIFTISLICHALYIFAHRTQVFQNPKLNATQLRWFLIPGYDWFVFPTEVILGIVMNFGCQILVLVSLVVMGIWLRRSVRFRKSAITETQSRVTKENMTSKETQALIQVAIVCAIFIVTNTPYVGFGIVHLLVTDFVLGPNFNRLYHNIMALAELCNSSVNFFVYFKYNSKFRACFPASCVKS